MKSAFIAAALAQAVLGTAAPLIAHHAFTAEFDRNKPITLVGTLRKVEWVNPHTWFHIEVTEPNGKSVIWRIEAGAPNQLMRRGWNRNSLKLGETLTVEGFRARTGEPTANSSSIKTADGRIFGNPQNRN